MRAASLRADDVAAGVRLLATVRRRAQAGPLATYDVTVNGRGRRGDPPRHAQHARGRADPPRSRYPRECSSRPAACASAIGWGPWSSRPCAGLDLEVDAGRVRRGGGPLRQRQDEPAEPARAAWTSRIEGQVLFAGADLASLTPAEKTQLRRRQLGFVFQSFNLLPVLSAFENVEYPLWIDGVPRADRRRRAEEALAAVGLGDRLRHRPDQLSGGERQRVSLARALVHEPLAILADEPTANLDSRTAAEVVDLLARMNAERGTTFLFATHDPAIVARAPRTIRLVDGMVVEDVARAAARPPGQLARGQR